MLLAVVLTKQQIILTGVIVGVVVVGAVVALVVNQYFKYRKR